uniref:Uncharacterized protein n=1 Tax=Anopheles atroparvus TaxID=41427 RepID=A0A182J186_ANOAO
MLAMTFRPNWRLYVADFNPKQINTIKVTRYMKQNALCGANSEKRLFVNDGKKLRVMYDPFTQCKILRDLENEMILMVSYDQSGLLIIFSPGICNVSPGLRQPG